MRLIKLLSYLCRFNPLVRCVSSTLLVPFRLHDRTRAVKVRLFIDILSHIITTSHEILSLESISLRCANYPPPIFVTYSLQTKPNYGVYDFNTNGHKYPRIAINIFMPHETQKAFTINSWIINGISCLENDIATQRLYRGGYLSHTNLTLTKSTCYARAGGCVESLNKSPLISAEGISLLRGGKHSSPRREILIFAEKRGFLHTQQGNALKVPPSIVDIY